jgi:hypothetical protein
LYGRNTFQADNALVGTNVLAFLQYDGMLVIGSNRNGVFQQFASVASGMDAAAYDVNMQFDIVGRGAALTVWRDGTAKPTLPQLRVSTIPSYVANEGLVGMFNVHFPSPGAKIPVEFRFFQAVPEPSTIALASLSGLVLASLTFHFRLVRVDSAR